MTENPEHTPPRFRPVPAFPVVIESARKGECRVRLDSGETGSGATLREALAAASISKTQELP